jgi:hypothetical protein
MNLWGISDAVWWVERVRSVFGELFGEVEDCFV